jgi:hypothetical protein
MVRVRPLERADTLVSNRTGGLQQKKEGKEKKTEASTLPACGVTQELRLEPLRRVGPSWSGPEDLEERMHVGRERI